MVDILFLTFTKKLYDGNEINRKQCNENLGYPSQSLRGMGRTRNEFINYFSIPKMAEIAFSATADAIVGLIKSIIYGFDARRLIDEFESSACFGWH
jgi:hypothetical protein